MAKFDDLNRLSLKGRTGNRRMGNGKRGTGNEESLKAGFFKSSNYNPCKHFSRQQTRTRFSLRGGGGGGC